MADAIWLGIATLIGGIGGRALVTLVAESRWRRAGLWIATVIGLGGATAIFISLLDAETQWVAFASQLAVTFGLGGAALVAVRTWLPGVLALRSHARKPESATALAAGGDRPSPALRGPIEEIYQDLLEKFGPDRARVEVAEVALERSKPRNPGAVSSWAEARMVRQKIRQDPERTRRFLGLLRDGEFSVLKGMADPRTEQEQAAAFDPFARAASELVETIDRCRAEREDPTGNDWEVINTLYGQARKALSGVPLDKHLDYAKDLAEIRPMIERRENPSSGRYPFILRDLRDRLSRDQQR
jgi:hypothetical protein